MLHMCSRAYVTVPVTTVRTGPTAPREVDRWAVAPLRGVVAWLADLDAAGTRPGLHGRVATQLERGEPVQIIGDAESRRAGPADQRWLQGVAPTQPSSLDARDHPGWVLAGQIGDKVTVRPQGASATTGCGGAATTQASVEAARAHPGISYLWGGASDAAPDCSGRVHLSLRRPGVVVPTDAGDQCDVGEHIPMRGTHPGDLTFFARDRMRAHHLGILTPAGRMLHAAETGSAIVEELFAPARDGFFVAAGRPPWPPPANGSIE
jgi:gamma-D-glutamyl-L-lysine dipeptidyl-peptidase